MSKFITALSVLALVEGGRIGLDDDVNRHLRSRSLPANEHTASRPITPRLLVRHLAEIDDSEDATWTANSFADLGAFLEGDEGEPEFFSYGWGKGFQRLLGAKPRSKSGVVVMANGNPGKHKSESVVGDVYRLAAFRYEP